MNKQKTRQHSDDPMTNPLYRKFEKEFRNITFKIKNLASDICLREEAILKLEEACKPKQVNGSLTGIPVTNIQVDEEDLTGLPPFIVTMRVRKRKVDNLKIKGRWDYENNRPLYTSDTTNQDIEVDKESGKYIVEKFYMNRIKGPTEILNAQLEKTKKENIAKREASLTRDGFGMSEVKPSVVPDPPIPPEKKELIIENPLKVECPPSPAKNPNYVPYEVRLKMAEEKRSREIALLPKVNQETGAEMFERHSSGSGYTKEKITPIVTFQVIDGESYPIINKRKEPLVYPKRRAINRSLIPLQVYGYEELLKHGWYDPFVMKRCFINECSDPSTYKYKHYDRRKSNGDIWGEEEYNIAHGISKPRPNEDDYCTITLDEDEDDEDCINEDREREKIIMEWAIKQEAENTPF
jgi:hypothetical protein